MANIFSFQLLLLMISLVKYAGEAIYKVAGH